jgi:hypothetical protein
MKQASIARIMMGDRINQDYGWFYGANMDFGFESFMFELAELSGDYSLFDDYLRYAYENQEDYFWQWASTGNDHQNMERYRNIPLFNADSLERVKEINQQKLRESFERYEATIYDPHMTSEGLWNYFKDNESLQEKFGYVETKFESIYMVGCMFIATKYGLEAITGKPIDTMEMHDFILNNKLYNKDVLLSNELMAAIMTRFSGGKFNVSLVETGLPSPARLHEYGESDDMYLAHLRIKKDGTGEGYHSVMVSGINFLYDKDGNVTGISSVEVANTWNDTSRFTGRTSYTMDQIARWDIFKAAPVKGGPVIEFKPYSVIYNTLR